MRIDACVEMCIVSNRLVCRHVRRHVRRHAQKEMPGAVGSPMHHGDLGLPISESCPDATRLSTTESCPDVMPERRGCRSADPNRPVLGRRIVTADEPAAHVGSRSSLVYGRAYVHVRRRADRRARRQLCMSAVAAVLKRRLQQLLACNISVSSIGTSKHLVDR